MTRFAVVTPVRDEARFLPRTAASLVAQDLRPVEWVIVDDGSTDGTREIAERLAAEHAWIRVVGTGEDGERARGAKVVRAFRHGLAHVEAEHDVVVKLDGDLHLPAHYLAWVGAVFAREPRAGLVGGRLLVFDGREWRPDAVGRHTVHGAVKAYRRTAYDEIGGLQRSMFWDGIDEYALLARGWRVRVLSELTVLHYAARGSRQGWWRPRWEEGRGMRAVGYRTDFALARSAFRMAAERPRVLGGAVMLASFAWHGARGLPTVGDPLAVAALRDHQRRRLRALVTRRGGEDPTWGAGGEGPAHW
jgi:poly-beta-1,6-N-acetyl-D-glucosamine synthase